VTTTRSTVRTKPPRSLRPADSGQTQNAQHKSEARTALLFASPSIAGLALFTLFPVLMSLVMSFYNWPAVGDRSATGIHNYTSLLSDPEFRRIVLNTGLFAVLYLPFNIALSLAMALWINTVRKGRQTLRVLFFLPVVTPMVANVLVWRMIYQPDGAIDGIAQVFGGNAPNFLGDPHWAMAALVLMSVWQGFGYNLLVFSAAIDNIPVSLNEAATLDGVGPWRRLKDITLPMISPAMFFASTMTLITTFQVFAQPYLLTGGGPGNSTTTLVLFVYRQGFSAFSLGVASAAAWVLFVIILVITALQFAGQRKWVNYDV
jgi:multiple sugar transport system permease protein